jgi:plasmid stabilization system protein ParE
MTFRVEITSEAERDADAILEWLLSQQAGVTGMHWFEALEDAIASVAEFTRRLYVGSRKQNVRSRSATAALWSQAEYLSRSLHHRGQLSVRPGHPSWPTRATETIMAIRRRRHISHNASTSTITFVRGIFCFSAWANMSRNTAFSFWRLGDFNIK